MNLYQGFVLALLLIAASSTFVNTTNFWKNKLNLTT
jgi:general stress protein CsbA